MRPTDTEERIGHGRVSTSADNQDSGTRVDRAAKAFHFARHKWLGNAVKDQKLSGATVKVAVLMWKLQNARRGCAWPSLDYIARELGMNKSTVTRAIKTLLQRGWITKSRGGRKNSNEYRLSSGFLKSDSE